MEAQRCQTQCCTTGKPDDDIKGKLGKHLLVLVYDYFLKSGYLNTATQLASEVRFSMEDYSVCDNISLELVLQEFMAYYHLKYNRQVHIAKKTVTRTDQPLQRMTKIAKPKSILKCPSDFNDIYKQRTPSKKVPEKTQPVADESERDGHNRQLRLYVDLGLQNEFQRLAEIVVREIIVKDLHVQWEDIVGHDRVKESLKEALVYPTKYPELYSIVSPWKGLLLYGPTGTGKTMLAKAAATECKSVFFNVSVSSFTSRWRGESEKLVSVLFDLARLQAPSIIFFDEFDCLMSGRSENDHEASRRFKSELLSRMDGLSTLEEGVFVLAASNLPWDIDQAMLRRLEQRIYVPVPDERDREALLKRLLPKKIATNNVTIRTNLDYKKLAQLTECYSGADVNLLAKEVKMKCIRQGVQTLETSRRISSDCIKNIAFDPIETGHVIDAIKIIKPINIFSSKNYKNFTTSHGTWL